MRLFSHVSALRSLMRDPNAHAGDIAVLKIDSFGLDARPALRDHLAPVRNWLPAIDVAALRALPAGTFGHAYAGFLDAHGLSPFVLTDAVSHDIRSRNAYGIRYATTHDMFHVLLGFGPDWVGEMGVLAFTCGQGYNRVLWAQAAFAWLLYPLWSGFAVGALREAWDRGYRAGLEAPFMLGERLEDQFGEPLEAVRARYGLVAPEVGQAA
ncbi:MAG: Coq4 family protein [Myxococcota bacterium]